MQNRIAFHFLHSDWTTYGNGTEQSRILVKVGEPLIHQGALEPCVSGLHASVRAIDALSYSKGPVITLVECEGEIIDHGTPADKFICRKRTALWGYDCTDELWTFARLAALEVLPLWPDAPAVVREFLETGDESLRAAAWAAAWATTWAAARDAARDAAWAAAWAATWDAARDAAWAATWAAARAATWAATWDAARDAARDATWAAARAATWDAALDRLNHILESLLIDGAVSRGFFP